MSVKKSLKLDRCHCLYPEDLTPEIIESCAHQGDCAEDVEFWRAELNFSIPRDLAVRGLKQYGAWDAAELAAKSDNELAEIVLWLACGAFRDGETIYSLLG